MTNTKPSVDRQLAEALREIKFLKEVAVVQAMKRQKNDELIRISIDRQFKLLTDEVEYYKIDNETKDRQVEHLNAIMANFTAKEAKYVEIIKKKDATDVELEKLKNEFLNLRNASNLLREELIVSEISNSKNEKNYKQDFKNAIQRIENEHKSRLDYEMKQHEKELEHNKRIHEEKVAKLNEFLAATLIEVATLKRVGAENH